MCNIIDKTAAEYSVVKMYCCNVSVHSKNVVNRCNTLQNLFVKNQNKRHEAPYIL
jgi:hypothetical protein